jgi:hypothetical protein
MGVFVEAIAFVLQLIFQKGATNYVLNLPGVYL